MKNVMFGVVESFYIFYFVVTLHFMGKHLKIYTKKFLKELFLSIVRFIRVKLYSF